MAKGDISNLLGGSFHVPVPESIPPEEQLLQAMDEAGLKPEIIHMDGKVHRFDVDKKGDKAGWYIVYPDGVPAGTFGNWKTNFQEKWCAYLGRELTHNERMQRDNRYAEAKAAREAEQEKKAEIVSDAVNIIWQNCPNAPNDHPYLEKKGVKAHGTKVTGDGRLVIPLLNADGKLDSLQYIAPDGTKRFQGEAGSKYWVLGTVKNTIYLAEGFATAASIHEATGDAVYICFSAGNMINIGGIIRNKHGDLADVVIVADNDESGTGERVAKETAQRWNMRYVLPPILGDANDYVQSGHDLLAMLKPKLNSDWLVSADAFSAKPQPICWLIKKWVQSNALLMVHGPSGGGKTFVVLDWCLRIGSEIDRWGGQPVKTGNVVYLAGEGHWGLKARIAAWKHYHKIKKVNMWLSKGGCGLNKEGYQMTVDHIRSLPVRPDLIVVDTLHRFLDGDENSAQDAGTMLNACNGMMAEFECSVLLVHHTGNSDEAKYRARGSSAWRGALDVEISVTKEKNGSAITLQQMKQKDAELSDPLYLDLQSVAIPGWIDEDGEQVTSAVVVEGVKSVEKVVKESKFDENSKRIERAWFASGEEMTADHNPFISRDALVDFLIKNDGFLPNSAKQVVKPGAKGKLIDVLLNAEVIKNSENSLGEVGWEVIDNNLKSVMLISRQQNKLKL